MKKTIMLRAVVTVCLATTDVLAAEEASGPQAARPLVTLTGTDSHVKQRSYHRIASQDEWIKVWQRHKGVEEAKDYDLFYNPLGLPYIDFEQCMVIAVFQGEGFNSAGLKAAAVLEKKDGIVLRIENKWYQTVSQWLQGKGVAADGGAKRATVYGFFVLPQSSKAVVLEENVQDIIGGPPVWKEKARLPK